jgi:hypothetical protein
VQLLGLSNPFTNVETKLRLAKFNNVIFDKDIRIQAPEASAHCVVLFFLLDLL